MFSRIRKMKMAAQFTLHRLSDYSELMKIELSEFRVELIKAVAGYVVLGVAGLFFLGFVSLAVLVSTWETDARVMTAWIICIFWGALAAGGFMYARQAMKAPSPFTDFSREVTKDLAVIREAL